MFNKGIKVLMALKRIEKLVMLAAAYRSDYHEGKWEPLEDTYLLESFKAFRLYTWSKGIGITSNVCEGIVKRLDSFGLLHMGFPRKSFANCQKLPYESLQTISPYIWTVELKVSPQELCQALGKDEHTKKLYELYSNRLEKKDK